MNMAFLHKNHPVSFLVLLFLHSIFFTATASGQVLTDSSQVEVATGNIRFPRANQTFSGNLIVSVRVQDDEGLGSVFALFPSSGQTLSLCAANCGTSVRRTMTGIKPANLGLTSGSQQMELWVTATNGQASQIDTVTFNWNPRQVSNLTSSRQPGSVTLNWSPVAGAFRYKLYMATEKGINPGNITSKANNQVFRSLTGTSRTVNGFNDLAGIFALVTAIDASGESAFSQELRIPAFNNQDPVTVNDTFSGDEDTTISGNVLANDSDPENAQLTATLETPPTQGTATLAANGLLTYQPNANFNGTDTFTYQAEDTANGVSVGQVTITLTPVNDAPVAADNDYELSEDTSLTIVGPQGPLSNDTDVDGDSLSWTISTPAQNGQLTLNGDNGFTYTPTNNFSGTDSFKYQLDDGAGGNDTGTVQLTILSVNDAPQANSDSYQIEEDQTLQGESGLANDTDPDIQGGDPAAELSASLVSNVSKGTLNLSANGIFTYQPNTNFSGSDQFTYQITDQGGLTSQAQVSIQIIGVNDAPVAQPDAYVGTEDTLLSIPTANGVLSNDSDSDSSGPLTASLSSPATSGAVNLSADGSFTYQPKENFFGSDSFSYQVSDTEGAKTSSTVTIDITGVNDVPVATDDEASTGLNESVQINVLANDKDPDGDTLSILSASGSNGTVTHDSQAISFTPAQNFFGTASVNYTITDGKQGQASATVSVSVAVGIPLNAENDQLSLDEDSTGTINVLENDTGSGVVSLLSASAGSGNVSITSNGNITYKPPRNVNGSATINYTISDASQLSASAQVIVTIIPVEDIPIANNDSIITTPDTPVNIAVLTNDSDGDNDPLTIISAQVVTGTISIQGGQSLLYTPPSGFSGNTTATYTISDNNGGTDSATVAIQVTNTNTPPTGIADSYTLHSGESAVTVAKAQGVLSNDSDPEQANNTLTASIVTPPSHSSSFSLSPDGSFTYQYDGNGNLTDSFSYKVSDGIDSSNAVTVNLTNATENKVPYICSVPSFSAQVGHALNDSIQSIDLDLESVTYAAANLPAWLTFNANGSFSGTPTDSDIGTTGNISFTVTDGKHSQTRGGFSITVYDDFGSANSIILDMGGIDLVEDMIIDGKGRILIAGSTGGNMAVARLLPNGSLDTSFDGDGIFTLDIGMSSDSANSIKVDKLGNIYVGGQGGISTDHNYIALKLLENGTLDSSFGTSGQVSLDLGASSQAYLADILLHDDGKISLVGYTIDVSTGHDLAISQLNPNGSLNNAFQHSLANDQTIRRAILDQENHIYITGLHTNGLDNDIYIARTVSGAGLDGQFNSGAPYFYDTGINESAYDIMFDGKGNLLLAGNKANDMAVYNFAVTRSSCAGVDSIALNTAGFNTGGTPGKLAVDFSGSVDVGHKLISDHHGHYYVVGKTDSSNIGSIKFSLSGTLDTSYGTSGKLTQVLTGGGNATATLDASGQMLFSAVSGNDLLVKQQRLLNNPGYEFCSEGTASDSTNAPLLTVDTMVAMVQSASSEFYLVGHSVNPQDSNQDIVIYKTDNDANADLNFGNKGFVRHDGGAGVSLTATHAASTSNGSIIVVGHKAGNKLYVAKYLKSGLRDTSFNSTGYTDFGNDITLTPVGMAVNASDEVFIAGINGSNEATVIKLTASGNDDISFGGGSGQVKFTNTDFVIKDMTLHSNGAVYLFGAHATTLAAAANLPTFESYVKDLYSHHSGSEIKIASHHSTSFSRSEATTSALSGDYEIALVKITSSGTVDSSFGATGLKVLSDSVSRIGKDITSYGGALYTLSQRDGANFAYVHKLDSNGNPISSFGSGGQVQFINSMTDTYSDIQVDSSGNIWGLWKNPSPTTWFIKLLPSGTQSKNFLNAGIAETYNSPGAWGQVAGFTFESTGEVMVYGTDNNDFMISHMTSNGAIINGENEIRIDFGTGDQGYQLAIDALSRPLVAGSTYNSTNHTIDFSIARFETGGAKDLTLASGSAVQKSDKAGQHDRYTVIDITDAQRIQTAGDTFSAASPTNADIRVRRSVPAIVTSGDDSFASSGITDLDLLGTSKIDKIHDQHIGQDGKTYLVGSHDNQSVVIRLNSDGTLDASFSTDGVFPLSVGAGSELRAITLDAEGYPVAVGNTTTSNDADGLIVRLNTNGTLDSSFNSSGYNTFHSDAGDGFTDITLSTNGHYILSGHTSVDTLVASYKKDGTLNTGFSSDGFDIQNLGNNDKGQAILRDPYGKIFVGITRDSQFSLLKYTDDGSLVQNYPSHQPGVVNQLTDIQLDTLGNLYMTGQVLNQTGSATERSWQFTIVRYPLVSTPN